MLFGSHLLSKQKHHSGFWEGYVTLHVFNVGSLIAHKVDYSVIPVYGLSTYKFEWMNEWIQCEVQIKGINKGNWNVEFDLLYSKYFDVNEIHYSNKPTF